MTEEKINAGNLHCKNASISSRRLEMNKQNVQVQHTLKNYVVMRSYGNRLSLVAEGDVELQLVLKISHVYVHLSILIFL